MTVLTNSHPNTRARDKSDKHHSVMVLPSTLSTSVAVDKIKGNSRSSSRARSIAIQKAERLKFYDERNPQKIAVTLIKEHRLGKRFEKKLVLEKKDGDVLKLARMFWSMHLMIAANTENEQLLFLSKAKFLVN